MTTLRAVRSGGEYLLRDAVGRQLGSLRVGRILRQGEIRAAEGRLPVRARGWRRVIVGDTETPLVRLGPDHVVVPGPGPQPDWSISRHRTAWQALLKRGANEIELRLTAFGARRCDADVSGDWEQRDVLVLAACYAMLLRRRRFVIIVAGGTH